MSMMSSLPRMYRATSSLKTNRDDIPTDQNNKIKKEKSCFPYSGFLLSGAYLSLIYQCFVAYFSNAAESTHYCSQGPKLLGEGVVGGG